MRFLVDNSLSPRLAEALRQLGHEAIHVGAIGLAQATDEIIFEAAAKARCVIIAQDTDFGTLLAKRRERYPSVMLFRCRVKSTEAILKLLTANLEAVTTDLDAGAAVVFEDTRIRLRRLPIGGP